MLFNLSSYQKHSAEKSPFWWQMWEEAFFSNSLLISLPINFSWFLFGIMYPFMNIKSFRNFFQLGRNCLNLPARGSIEFDLFANDDFVNSKNLTNGWTWVKISTLIIFWHGSKIFLRMYHLHSQRRYICHCNLYCIVFAPHPSFHCLRTLQPNGFTDFPLLIDS